MKGLFIKKHENAGKGVLTVPCGISGAAHDAATLTRYILIRTVTPAGLP